MECERVNIAELPRVSADAPDWLEQCDQFARAKQNFLLYDVTSDARMKSAVDFIVRNRLWIEVCEGGSLIVLGQAESCASLGEN